MLDQQTVDLYFSNDEDIDIVERIDDGTYRLSVKVPGVAHYEGHRAELLVSTKINSAFVIFFSRVDQEHLGFALAACEASNVVGLISLGGGFMLRATLFAEFSEPLALNNMARGMAMAKLEYDMLVRS